MKNEKWKITHKKKVGTEEKKEKKEEKKSFK